MSADSGNEVPDDERLEWLLGLDQDQFQRIQKVARGPVYTRRQIAKYLGTGAAAALAGGASTGAVAADASTSDGDGNVGLPGDRGDVFADGVDANFVNSRVNATNKIDNGDAANLREAIVQSINDIAPDGGEIIIERGSYSWPSSLDIVNDTNADVSGYTPIIINGQGMGNTGTTNGTTIDISGISSGYALRANTKYFELFGVEFVGGGKMDGVTAIAAENHQQRYISLGIRDTQVAFEPRDSFNVLYENCEVQQCGFGVVHENSFATLHRWVTCDFTQCGSAAGDYAVEFRSAGGQVQSCKFDQCEWQQNDGGAVKINNAVRNVHFEDCDSEANCNTTATDYVYLFDDANSFSMEGLVSAAESPTIAEVGIGINTNCSNVSFRDNRVGGGTVDVDAVNGVFVYERNTATLDMTGGSPKGRYENSGFGSYSTTLADTATAALDPTANSTQGMYLINDTSAGTLATVVTRGGINDTSIMSDPDNMLSTTAGNTGTTNVYWSSGNSRYEIENQAGGSNTYEIYSMRLQG